jgi:hypothetical protein
MLQPIIDSLERVAFNGDPLQFMLIETGYQPFISLFHELDIVKENPDMQAIREFLCDF